MKLPARIRHSSGGLSEACNSNSAGQRTTMSKYIGKTRHKILAFGVQAFFVQGRMRSKIDSFSFLGQLWFQFYDSTIILRRANFQFFTFEKHNMNQNNSLVSFFTRLLGSWCYLSPLRSFQE